MATKAVNNAVPNVQNNPIFGTSIPPPSTTTKKTQKLAQEKIQPIPNPNEPSRRSRKFTIESAFGIPIKATRPTGRSSVEATRYSIDTEEKTKFSPQDTPNSDHIERFFSRSALSTDKIENTAEDLINISLFSDGGTPKIVQALEGHYKSLFTEDLDVEDEKATQYRLEQFQQFYDLLVVLSTYSGGIPIVCAYTEKLGSNESDQMNQIAKLIYQHHKEKQTLLTTLPIFTQADLQVETTQTLFRNATLTSKLCQEILNDLLGPTLEGLIEHFIDKLKKHNAKKNSALKPLFTDFLNELYAMKIPDEVKKMAKMRQKSIHEHFKTSRSSEELNQLAHAGINQLLFLSFINAFFIKFVEGKTYTDPEKQVVKSLTAIIQQIANQKPFNEGSSNAEYYNTIYEEFKTTHRKLIEGILK